MALYSAANVRLGQIGAFLGGAVLQIVNETIRYFSIMSIKVVLVLLGNADRLSHRVNIIIASHIRVYSKAPSGVNVIFAYSQYRVVIVAQRGEKRGRRPTVGPILSLNLDVLRVGSRLTLSLDARSLEHGTSGNSAVATGVVAIFVNFLALFFGFFALWSGLPDVVEADEYGEFLRVLSQLFMQLVHQVFKLS